MEYTASGIFGNGTDTLSGRSRNVPKMTAGRWSDWWTAIFAVCWQLGIAVDVLSRKQWIWKFDLPDTHASRDK